MNDVKRLLKDVARMGWRIEGGGSRHYMCYSPCGKHIVCVSASGSDHRTYVQARSDFRRAGAKV